MKGTEIVDSDLSEHDTVLPELQEARKRFLQLISELRPDLHRYCARMTGSIADGEDIVQDTLARAYYELSGLKELPALRSWLFRIAHNRALDYLKRYGPAKVEEVRVVDEDVRFPLPKEVASV